MIAESESDCELNCSTFQDMCCSVRCWKHHAVAASSLDYNMYTVIFSVIMQTLDDVSTGVALRDRLTISVYIHRRKILSLADALREPILH